MKKRKRSLKKRERSLKKRETEDGGDDLQDEVDAVYKIRIL